MKRWAKLGIIALVAWELSQMAIGAYLGVSYAVETMGAKP